MSSSAKNGWPNETVPLLAHLLARRKSFWSVSDLMRATHVLEVSVFVRSLLRDVGFRCQRGVVNRPNEVGRGFVVKRGFGKCESSLFACSAVCRRA